MEGGVAILLLMIIVAVAAVIGIAMYFTGGALWFSRTSTDGDTLDGSGRGGRFRRPKHKKVTSKTIENTHVVGTRDDD
jgi:uncharacterized iron-regulated membrane protein